MDYYKDQYDIVLSYAEEDDAVAAKLARMLQDKGITVYYDKFNEAERLGKNTIDHDNAIFGRAGKYCVVILSQYFGKDHVTKLQRQIIECKAAQAKDEYILPLRLDDSPIDPYMDQLFGVAYKENEVEKFVNLVCKKLGVKKEETVLGSLRHLFNPEKKSFVRFEMQSDADFSSPFLFAVAEENDKILKMCKYKDIRIIGCDVMPYRIQLQATPENYEHLRTLFLTRQINKLTNLNWTKISVPLDSMKLTAPKQVPLALASAYGHADPNGMAETVVCHAMKIKGFDAQAGKAVSIIGQETVSSIDQCKIFISYSSSILYLHSNYIKAGCKYPTKIGSKRKVSLFVMLINLTCLEWPTGEEMYALANAHQKTVKYYVDASSDELGAAFFAGADNVEFV
jgi:hypothetical protein